ncbi:hypothetical protein HZA56_13825 [Candidatus Poribacteria bacterium]|nr:hypothetical protein [Candidatus Poribacteria bacterium]
MSAQPEIIDIEFSVDVDDLMGPLGYAPSGAAATGTTVSGLVSPAIMELILSEKRRCEEVMQGRAIYTLAEIDHRNHGSASDAATASGVIRFGSIEIEDETLAGFIEDARSIAVAVCTIGPEVDALIERYFRENDFLRGMVADVTASRAAEDAAERLTAIICSKAQACGLSAARRQSPGYGEWDVSGQRAVFALLNPSPIGVSLNDHCMMTPRKSVSFVIPLIENNVCDAAGKTGDMMPEKMGDMMPHRVPDFLDKNRPQQERPCHACSFKNCSYRRK